jgi:PPK2 family polyphosphate:nucleotide phosphotransferase
MKNLLHDKNIYVPDGKNFKLAKYRTDHKFGLQKARGKQLLEDVKSELAELQHKLYAKDRHSVLIVFQAMDAAGKDGTIRTVMSGVNPQGCHVAAFKQPSAEELDHDYLWRIYKMLPETGKIGIFNRSHYEEVLVTRVHPEYILGQKLPGINSIGDINAAFWQKRYNSIRQMEEHLVENGTIILKFFLHVSREEQKARFLERVDDPAKNWKFSYGDIKERKFWDAYQHAYEQAIIHTATPQAPWYIIPADSNWSRNYAVCSVIVEALRSLKLRYPSISDADRELLLKGKKELLAE